MALPPLDEETGSAYPHSAESESESEAPWGLKADGTPRKKPGRKAGSSTGSGVSRSRSSVSDTAFAQRISDELVELSAPLAIVSPMAMGHVARRVDRTANALVNISRKHPRVKAAIITYFDSVAYKDIALFVLGIPIMVMIDYGKLKPDSKAGFPFQAQEIWMECYGDTQDGSEFSPNGASYRGLAAELG